MTGERRASGRRPTGLLSRRATLAIAAGTVAGGGLTTLTYRQLSGTDRPPTATPPPSDRPRASGSVPATSTSPGFTLPAGIDAEHLLRRATYGPSPALRAEIARSGPTAWLTAQLAPSRLTDRGGDDVIHRFPKLAWSPARAARDLPYDDRWALMTDLGSAHLGRAAWSNRQLLEVMVDFWSNHLNVTNPSDGVWHTRHRYDADVIRRHALGRFEDLLVASAFHPAMLAYLNAADSTGTEPNENYARELLELHTVGVHGGYTERDVKQAALLITGWTLDERGAVRYEPRRHHAGPVKVMGWQHANASRAGGRAAVVSLLGHLAHHPATARLLATKLAVRFVADDPPPELVARLAAVYLEKGTAIVPVLTTLFSSPEFAASAGSKLRRPMEVVVATVRVLGVGPGHGTQGLLDLYWSLNAMGHRPLSWPTPDGFPDVARKWQSPAAALNQLNTVNAMVQGWWPNRLALPRSAALYPKRPHTRDAAMDAAARRVLGHPATPRQVAALEYLLKSTPNLPRRLSPGSWEQEETLALATTLLLNDPAHLTR